MRKTETLRQKRLELQIEAATKIQSHWRSFFDYREYMILLGGVYAKSIYILLLLSLWWSLIIKFLYL